LYLVIFSSRRRPDRTNRSETLEKVQYTHLAELTCWVHLSTLDSHHHLHFRVPCRLTWYHPRLCAVHSQYLALSGLGILHAYRIPIVHLLLFFNKAVRDSPELAYIRSGPHLFDQLEILIRSSVPSVFTSVDLNCPSNRTSRYPTIPSASRQQHHLSLHQAHSLSDRLRLDISDQQEESHH